MTNAPSFYGPLVWLGYLALAVWLITSRRQPDSRSAHTQRHEHAAIGLLLLIQAPLVFAPLMSTQPHFGASEALALLTWSATLIYWTAAFSLRLEGLQLILIPVATTSQAIALLLPAGHATPWLAAPLMQLHFAIAMLAYAFFAVTAGLAVLMWVADRQLHRPAQSLLSQLPPLIALERLLFLTMTLGLALLTATLATGTLFTEELFGAPFRLNHKLVFSVSAWLVFSGLLWARRARGLRGRAAAIGTLTGFSFLLLAYIGSRFVLDIVLQRAG
ncbi:inner membrane protein YpjD [Chitinimonas sp.]|uniref:cytochrome C assembly family protein n=1 Tax=Chitinimonas sp. TaxID=1934313 RepID=UPI0035B19934